MSYGVSNTIRLNLRDYYFWGKSWLNREKNVSANVLCNSFPKSGTHLLAQILMQLNGIKYWNDIVSVQALTGVMNTSQHLRWKLGSVPAGSLVRSHLMYCPEVLEILKLRPYKQFFIYRDLRDVALSHSKWVMKENKIFLNGIYANSLKSDDERLMTSICGIPLGSPFASNFSLPSIGQDFSRWEGWLSDSHTLSIKFEDLVGTRGGGSDETKYKTIRLILDHLEISMTEDEIRSSFSDEALNPAQSHTFRKGQKGAIGGWREYFKEQHKEAFKTVAGHLLIKLGYETSMEW